MYSNEELPAEIYALLQSELGNSVRLEGEKLKKFSEFFNFTEVYPIFYNKYNIFVTHKDEFLLEVCSQQATQGLITTILLRIPEHNVYLCALNYTGHSFLSSLLN